MSPEPHAPRIAESTPRPLSAFDQVLSPYECVDRADVEAFLRSRQGLEGLLREVPGKAQEFFGDDARVGLEVVQDAEYFVTPELFVFVVTSLPADEAWKRFLRMESEWWVETVRDPSVNLDVRY